MALAEMPERFEHAPAGAGLDRFQSGPRLRGGVLRNIACRLGASSTIQGAKQLCFDVAKQTLQPPDLTLRLCCHAGLAAKR